MNQTDHVCMDEVMIPYNGKHSAKQFIKGKPIRSGYKLMCLNMTLRYLIQCQLYAGKCSIQPDIGHSASALIELLDSLPKDARLQVTCDNFFTSLPLLQALGEKGLIGIGSLRACEQLPTTRPKDHKKEAQWNLYLQGVTGHGDNGFKLPVCDSHQEGSSLFPSTERGRGLRTEDWPTSDWVIKTETWEVLTEGPNYKLVAHQCPFQVSIHGRWGNAE